MKAVHLYHVGIVTGDFDKTLDVLTRTAGYRWPEELRTDNLLVAGETETIVPLRCAYSRDEPLQAIPGTLFSPPGGPRIELVHSASKASAERWWATGVLGG